MYQKWVPASRRLGGAARRGGQVHRSGGGEARARGARARRSQHHGRQVVRRGCCCGGGGERGRVRVGRGQCGRVCLQRGAGRPVARALLVRAQAGQLRVGALAHLALIGALARVQAHVVAQRGRLAETAVAEAAHEGLVQRVDAHVRAQVAAGVETSVADDAAHAARGAGRGVRRVEVLWQRAGRMRDPRRRREGKRAARLAPTPAAPRPRVLTPLKIVGHTAPRAPRGCDCGLISVTLHQDPTCEDLVTWPQETLAFSSEKRVGRGKRISEFQTSQDYVQRPCLTKQKAGESGGVVGAW